jgi:hypothetical protein
MLGSALSGAMSGDSPEHEPQAAGQELTVELLVDMVKDLATLVLAGSTIPPDKIVARFNNVRKVLDTPQYSDWLGY